MAVLPTYAEIGMTASCIMILCRVIQGMTAMGECIGAQVYITETVKPPMQYPMVTLVSVFAVTGGMVALAVGSFAANVISNWRFAFWLGLGVAIIGMVARTTLRETPDFADAKRSLEEFVKQTNRDPKLLTNSAIWQEKVNKLTAFSLFLIQCAYPLIFYFVYIHCGTIMRQQFGFTPEQIMNQNLIVILCELASIIFLTYLSYKIYPLKILKVLLIISTFLLCICPYLLNYINSPWQLLSIQISIILVSTKSAPATPIFYKHFPVFRRFTMSCMMYALGRAVMFVITSYGLVFLIDIYGNWGLLILATPILLGYKFALSHFEKLEQEQKVGT
ncbi:MAG: MFS transporter [Rickettsiaceae bacterium]